MVSLLFYVPFIASSDGASKEGSSSPIAEASGHLRESFTTSSSRLDPPEDEPPSLKKDYMEENFHDPGIMSPSAEASVDEHGFYSVQQSLHVATIHDHMMRPNDYPDQYVSPESFSHHGQEFVEEEPTPVIPHHYFEETPPSHGANIYFNETPRLHEIDSDYEDEGPLDADVSDYSNAMEHHNFKQDNQPNQDYFGSEEKKFGMEKDDVDSQLENSVEFVKNDGDIQNQRFINTSLPYNGDPSGAPFSPGEASTNTGYDSQSHQSPAMRGAHEILKKRRRRFEM